MKKLWIGLLGILAVSMSCKNAPVEFGQVCSVKLTNVEFTKSLNNAQENATVVNDTLTLRSDARRDNFCDPDGKLSNNTAPVLLAKVNNLQPFTLTAKVTPTFIETYDAGALYVYLNEKLWVKFAFERDERARTRIVTVRTIGTSDDNNHDVIDSTGVYMKITSDTKTIAYYYSLDNVSWQLVRLYRNDYPAEIWVGPSAQSPLGEGNSVIFTECSLVDSCVKDFRLGI
ncbi:MAG TPA: DUF1349 domain-containing protein [bacterium]|nr:DUF1349 domain-containing protein [bacterium]HPN43879.1 DUF1349 domain-containing protein [bacterium]